MGENGFYITLPSNACAKVFPQNTSASFTTQLARPLELTGDWEVGLAEIHYPHSWNTITEDATFEISNGVKKWVFFLQRGYYASIPELLDHMNNVMQAHEDPPEMVLHYDTVARKVRLKPPFTYTFLANGELAYILGLFPGNPVKKLPFTADITAGFSTLYIYSDIVTHQIVGDYYVPLLRCVPIRGESSENVTITYDKPHYVSVNRDHADTISVEIKTDQNKNVSFRFGKVIVKLHFRPRKTCLF